MRLALSAAVLALLLFGPANANSATLTFENIPHLGYYGSTYNIVFSYGFYLADHSASLWGPPHSGNKVLAVESYDYVTIMLKTVLPQPPQLFRAYSVSGYFSTAPGAVVTMNAYQSNLDELVASVTIGAQGQSWNNVYVELTGMPSTIGFIRFTGDLYGFCADDVTVNFVPEPSSLLALLTGLAGLGAVMRRRRQSRS